MTRTRNIQQLIHELPDSDERTYLQLRYGTKTSDPVGRFEIGAEVNMSLPEIYELETRANRLLSTAARQSAKTGHSLIELVTVLTIMSVMAAVGVISFHKIQSSVERRNQLVTAGMLRTAANLSAIDKNSIERRSLIVTQDEAASWLKGGWDRLSIDGAVPVMPEMTSDEYFFAEREDIADRMWK